MIHQPVLVKEVIEIFNPQANQNYIDATFGFGGHSLEILKKTSPEGKILAIEWDPKVIKLAQKYIMKKFPQYEKRIIFKNKNYREIKKIVKEEKFYNFVGILFDLGVSTYHLKKSKRGFSFQGSEPLDMRFNPKIKVKAEDILNTFDQKTLEKVFKMFEVRKADKIAKGIVEARKIKQIKKTDDLVNILSKINCDKKTLRLVFQALRLLINDELENIYLGLKDAIEVAPTASKIIVITYQGLENKIVKKIIKEKKKEVKIIAKIRPTRKEIQKNPKAHSAQLIALQKQNAK